MVVCSVQNCRGTTGHLFPKDPHLRKRWLEFVEREEVGRYAIVCKAHFTDDDFRKNAAIDGMPSQRDRLIPDAVPSIPDPAPYMPPLKKPRLSPQVSKKKIEPDQFKSQSRAYRYKYAQLNGTAEQVYQSQVRALRVAILTDPQMIRLLDNVKRKFMQNAPASASFPRHWADQSLTKNNRLRDGFPPFSMPCLVTMAIESTHTRFATKLQILAFISKNFPCYKLGQSEWQNSVSQTIDAYKLFRKLPIRESPNPRMTYYTFTPTKKLFLTPEAYEAFTDPRFDESRLDSAQAVAEIDCGLASEADEDDSIADQDGTRSNTVEFGNESSLEDLSEDEPYNSDEIGNPKTQPNSLSVWEILSCGEDDDESGKSDSEKSTVDSERTEGNQEPTLFRCCFCNFTSGNNRVTAEHLLVTHLNGVVYCCTICDYVASSTELLGAHKLVKHSDSEFSDGAK